MRISDWSSDVCSSDLKALPGFRRRAGGDIRLREPCRRPSARRHRVADRENCAWSPSSPGAQVLSILEEIVNADLTIAQRPGDSSKTERPDSAASCQLPVFA